jgi:hypothetical protein
VDGRMPWTFAIPLSSIRCSLTSQRFCIGLSDEWTESHFSISNLACDSAMGSQDGSPYQGQVSNNSPSIKQGFFRHIPPDHEIEQETGRTRCWYNRERYWHSYETSDQISRFNLFRNANDAF